MEDKKEFKKEVMNRNDHKIVDIASGIVKSLFVGIGFAALGMLFLRNNSSGTKSGNTEEKEA